MVRNANVEDIDNIVQVHKNCFSNSFSSKLGKRLLKAFYLTYYNQNPDLFFVSLEDEIITGFCMGYLCSDINLTKKFIKEHFIHLFFRGLFLTITFNKQMWKKIKERFKRKKNTYEVVDLSIPSYNKMNSADLLSICVLDSHKGKGDSHELVDCFVKSLLLIGMAFCFLTVDINNKRAISFYKKENFTVYKKNHDHYIMVKSLTSL